MDAVTRALATEAAQHLRAGNIAQGIDAHHALLAAQPDLPAAWYNLGYLLRCARRFDEALAAYGTAIDRGIARVEEVRVNRAAILSEHLERADEAEAELNAAIAANPSFALAWLNLGVLREDRGDTIAARAAYGEALAINPVNGRGHARMTAIDVFEGRADAAAARLQQALAVAPSKQRVELHFALGHALDALGRYDEAFASFARGNAEGRPPLRYDHAAHDRLIDELIRTFPGQTAKASESSGRAPIFICGMFRSGSTLCEQVLARQPGVGAAGELELIPVIVAGPLHPYPATARSARSDDFDQMGRDYLVEAAARHPQAARITDKRPDNFLHIGLIQAMFPDARMVHTVRDFRDVALSLWFNHFDDSVAYSFDLSDIAHYMAAYRRLMAHWQRAYPEAIFDFDYDRFVVDPAPTARALFDFCGIGSDGTFTWSGTAVGSVRTASVWQVRQPIHARSAGRWRNYATQLEPFLDALTRDDEEMTE